MTVKDIIEPYDFEILAGKDGMNAAITGVYCCDLLSMVMGKAFKGCCWVTIMGNINSIAVASLADVACIIYAENVMPDKNTIERAEILGIPLLRSDNPIFETALSVHHLLQNEELVL